MTKSNKLKGFCLPTSAQQVSYERSSQAQSLTIPPNLLTAAGCVGFRRMAFEFVEKESLN
jgi:hypothetical protein